MKCLTNSRNSRLPIQLNLEEQNSPLFIIISAKILSMEQDLLQRITINPKICHGKLTIRNKRYPVENILELMASGMTNEEILADYEDLEKEDLFACLLFAAKLANVGSITVTQ